MQKRLRLRHASHARDARVPRRPRLHRHRDADAHQGDARRRARLPRAEPHASRQVLRAAAVAADLQAAADDVRASTATTRSCAASATRTCAPTASPSSRSSTSRRRSSTRERDHGAHGRADPRTSSRDVLEAQLPDPFPRMTYAEAMRRYGVRQAGPAHPARARRRRRPRARRASSRCSRRRRPTRTDASRRCACRGGGKLSRKQIDDYTAFVGALRREGPRLRQGQRRGEGPRGPAVADPEVPVRRGGRRRPRAHAARRAATSSSSAPTSAKVVNDALGALRLQARAATSASWQRAGGRSGSSTSRCSSGTPDAKRWVAMHHPFTAPADRRSVGAHGGSGERRWRAPTTWC